MGHVNLLGLLWSLKETLSLLWFPPSCPVWLLVDGLAGRGWNVADLAFPSPALPHSWPGWPQCQMQLSWSVWFGQCLQAVPPHLL